MPYLLLVRAGPVELAAVGVSIALFNQVSRVAIFPLVSVTTSFVAEEDTLSGASTQIEEGKCLEAGQPMDTETKELLPQKGTIPSAILLCWVWFLAIKGFVHFQQDPFVFLVSNRWKCSQFRLCL